ncbi:hypothetical protein BU26DRAFT_51708 [Trematosphaeria pertusa]|uniref:Secreted protein n=1 Tax=Trematosphaeria pertusa TaxID=390896 RepID=A0A6A6IB43_9PLEO|nr:uncharacterized protein BU26DRAFT_51708 [Trematosphaeria pertusa]KAF2246713.1 hypothetical protein BU26DRAFT_51708 [Trematosphaeria pertusa]
MKIVACFVIACSYSLAVPVPGLSNCRFFRRAHGPHSRSHEHAPVTLREYPYSFLAASEPRLASSSHDPASWTARCEGAQLLRSFQPRGSSGLPYSSRVRDVGQR